MYKAVMHLAITVIVLGAILQNASALNCFVCAASLTSDCFNGDTTSMVTIDCAAAVGVNTTISPIIKQDLRVERDEVIVPKCLTYVATLFGMTFIERNCGYIYEGADICQYMEVEPSIHACSWCDEDLCNYEVLELPA